MFSTHIFLKPKIQPGLNNVFLEEAGGRGSRMMVMVMVMVMVMMMVMAAPQRGAAYKSFPRSRSLCGSRQF